MELLTNPLIGELTLKIIQSVPLNEKGAHIDATLHHPHEYKSDVFVLGQSVSIIMVNEETEQWHEITLCLRTNTAICMTKEASWMLGRLLEEYVVMPEIIEDGFSGHLRFDKELEEQK